MCLKLRKMDSIEDPEERQIVEDEIKKNVRKVEGKTRKEIIKKYKNIIKEEVNKRVGEDAEHIKAKNSNDPMSTRPTYLGTWSNGHWKGIQGSFFFFNYYLVLFFTVLENIKN